MAKKKSKKQGNKRLYILIGILLLSVVLLAGTLSKNQTKPDHFQPQPKTSPTPSIKLYNTTLLKAIFNVPSNYEVQEQPNVITIKTRSGNIKLEKIYTNSTTIEDYLRQYDSRRKLEVIEDGKLEIAGYKAQVRIEKFLEGIVHTEKVYFIYVPDGIVFIFSTSSENLYSDLDQIARSFQYKP